MTPESVTCLWKVCVLLLLFSFQTFYRRKELISFCCDVLEICIGSHKTILEEFERLKQHYLVDPDSPLNLEPNGVEFFFCEDNQEPPVLDRASSPSAQPNPSFSSSSSSSLQSPLSGTDGISRPRFDHDMALDLVAITPYRVGLKTTFNREVRLLSLLPHIISNKTDDCFFF
jgi:hypothetical protein